MAGRTHEHADHTLIDGVRNGDHGAFESLYRRHHPSVVRITSNRIEGNPAISAEDVQQEAWLGVWASRGSLPVETAGNWIRGITFKKTHDVYRRKKLKIDDKPVEELDQLGVIAGMPAPEDQFVERMRGQELADRLGQLLGQREAESILLHAEGATHNEASEVLGITENNSRRVRKRALDALHQAGQIELLFGYGEIPSGKKDAATAADNKVSDTISQTEARPAQKPVASPFLGARQDATPTGTDNRGALHPVFSGRDTSERPHFRIVGAVEKEHWGNGLFVAMHFLTPDEIQVVHSVHGQHIHPVITGKNLDMTTQRVAMLLHRGQEKLSMLMQKEIDFDTELKDLPPPRQTREADDGFRERLLTVLPVEQSQVVLDAISGINMQKLQNRYGRGTQSSQDFSDELNDLLRAAYTGLRPHNISSGKIDNTA